MKQLIVTADDYGVFPSINEGVHAAVLAGKVNSVAALPNHRDSVKNVQTLIALAGDKVDIGCHLTISSGEPLLVKHNEAFTSGKYFRQFTGLKITRLENQAEALFSELCAQVEVFLDSGLPLTNLSCHHNTLTFTKKLFEVYLRVADRYKLPIRSVDIFPDTRDNLYRTVMQAMLIDDIPLSRIREIRKFGTLISGFLKANYPHIKSPLMLESRHYGPPPGRDIWEHSVPRLVEKKQKALFEFMEEFASKDTFSNAELMLHLIDYQTYLNGEDEGIDYPGINKAYFDSRRLEFDSIQSFPFEHYTSRVKLEKWKTLFAAA